MQATVPECPPAAAVVYAERGGVDTLLADLADALKERGHRIRGLVQKTLADAPDTVLLVDLERGDGYPLFQNLGAGSTSCGLDTQGIAAASMVLRRALDEHPDLVVVNRFGALEASGAGFADEMLALMSEGIPLLTAVAEKNLASWRAFTGHLAAELPPTREALEAWFADMRRELQPQTKP